MASNTEIRHRKYAADAQSPRSALDADATASAEATVTPQPSALAELWMKAFQSDSHPYAGFGRAPPLSITNVKLACKLWSVMLNVFVERVFEGQYRVVGGYLIRQLASGLIPTAK